jgi:hypothetical protein
VRGMAGSVVWRVAALTAMVGAALLAAPASAPAATSCDFMPTSRLLNIEMSADRAKASYTVLGH